MNHTLTTTATGVHLRVKVVPGASRTKIAGVLGDRLKVAVSAPPEGDKANRAVCALIAKACGAPARDVTIVAGQTDARKTVAIEGVTRDAALEALRAALPPARK